MPNRLSNLDFNEIFSDPAEAPIPFVPLEQVEGIRRLPTEDHGVAR